MSEITDAIRRLNSALDHLEVVAGQQEQKIVQLQQQDLFGEGASPQANGHYGVDPTVIARKLDSAIAKVEQVLREG